MSQNHKVRVQARIDEDVVDKANQILAQLGINTTTFLNMTYQQLVQDRGLPFTPKLSQETLTNLDKKKD